MTAPFYQVKMVVGDVYVEYTTSDRGAMDKFLGDKETVVNDTQEPTLVGTLKRVFKGNSEWE